MPVLSDSKYTPPRFLGNRHIQTSAPSFFRPTPQIEYVRERLETPDCDFLQLDWSMCTPTQQPKRLAILTHGLEGNTTRPYMKGMAKALNATGFDVLARNCRGCGGEPNLRARSYHSGETDDLHHVVRYASQMNIWEQIVLVGFSMGGNQTLKYLGEAPDRIPKELAGAVAISAPCDLTDSVHALSGSSSGFLYTHYLLRSLRKKVLIKHEMFPELIQIRGLGCIHSFEHFDNQYTAPLFGFRDAHEYWQKASSRPVLKNISVPTLLLNARNDPFLGPGCFPVPEAQANNKLTLEMPENGGHVGFIRIAKDGLFWSELRAVEFLRTACA